MSAIALLLGKGSVPLDLPTLRQPSTYSTVNFAFYAFVFETSLITKISVPMD